jgi:hypothetical protein
LRAPALVLFARAARAAEHNGVAVRFDARNALVLFFDTSAPATM